MRTRAALAGAALAIAAAPLASAPAEAMMCSPEAQVVCWSIATACHALEHVPDELLRCAPLG